MSSLAPAIDLFDDFSSKIENALASRNYQLFAELISERSNLIEHLKLTGGIPDLPEDIVNRLLDENTRWISAAKEIKNETKAAIDAAQTLESGRKHIISSYSLNSSAGTLVSGCG